MGLQAERQFRFHPGPRKRQRLRNRSELCRRQPDQAIEDQHHPERRWCSGRSNHPWLRRNRPSALRGQYPSRQSCRAPRESYLAARGSIPQIRLSPATLRGSIPASLTRRLTLSCTPLRFPYDSAFAGAYVTQICNALSPAQCSYRGYDLNTGFSPALRMRMERRSAIRLTQQAIRMIHCCARSVPICRTEARPVSRIRTRIMFRGSSKLPPHCAGYFDRGFRWSGTSQPDAAHAS